MSFRLTATKYHVTWKSFVAFDKVKELFDKVGKVVALSIVHEVGQLREQDAMAYEHTHAAVLFAKKLDCADVKIWDDGDIHPHVKNRRSMPWIKYLFEVYHQGHKVDKQGKKYFIAPVAIEQITPPNWNPTSLTIAAVVDAATAVDAFDIADVGIKSIGDVITVRRECAKSRKHKHDFDDACTGTFVKKPKGMVDWDKSKALILVGDSGCGKTSWACQQFKNPIMIGELIELKKFNWDGVDGLVLDEADFVNYKRKTQIFMTDTKYRRVIKVEDGQIVIPKGMPRIFCNNQVCFKELPEIKRRCQVWDTRQGGEVDVPVYFEKEITPA